MLDVMARPKHDGAESGHQLPLDDGAYDSNDNMCDICCDFVFQQAKIRTVALIDSASRNVFLKIFENFKGLF